MKISIYTFVKEGLYMDFHVVEMLKHHLDFADEIIVNEGYSTDGTYEAIKDLHEKIHISRNQWDQSDPKAWHANFKDHTRKLCTGDWCILLDCDEFIPEWEFEKIRAYVSQAPQSIAVVPLKLVHFYGNYKVYNPKPAELGWPVQCNRIHRNLENIEVWGDGCNVRIKDSQDRSYIEETPFECHHFGFVRNAARLRQKWRRQAKEVYADKPRWDKTPGLLFDMFPHQWDDEDFLSMMELYEGPLIKAVKENPSEFVRDNFLVHKLKVGVSSVR